MIRYIFVLVLFLGNIAFAQTDKYIVGVEDYNRYPFQYTENGIYKGRFREILDKFAQDERIKFEYVPYKIKDLYPAFFEEKIDLKFPDNPVWRSPQKAKYKVYYSDFLTYYIDGIFVFEKDINISIPKLYKFGVVDDIILWSLLKKQKRKKIEIINATSCAELVNMLLDGKIRGIFCNYDVMRHLLKNSEYKEKIVMNFDLPFIDNYYHISSIKHPDLIEKFNKWIVKNRDFVESRAHEK